MNKREAGKIGIESQYLTKRNRMNVCAMRLVISIFGAVTAETVHVPIAGRLNRKEMMVEQYIVEG